MGMLELKDITKTFSYKMVLNGVSLSVNEGELFFLLGPSGCGKTTLLRIIAGLVSPDKGSIMFRNNDLLVRPVEKRNIGMVFQQFSLWPHMTIYDNVAYGLKLRKVLPDDIKSKVSKALEMVGLGGYEKRKPGTLSGGEQQRTALARALVCDSDIILLDEPLSNLDAKLRTELRLEIKRIQKSLGVTMVYVTHDQEEASSMADKIAVMRNGSVVQTGTPAEIYEKPQSVFAAEFFGSANIIRGEVIEVDLHKVIVKCGDLSICALNHKSIKVGDRVVLVIRHQDVAIGSRLDEINTFKAVLESREYYGAFSRYHFDVNGFKLIMLDYLRQGEKITGLSGANSIIMIPPEKILVLADEMSSHPPTPLSNGRGVG